MKYLMILTVGVCVLFAAMSVMAQSAADEASVREAIKQTWADFIEVWEQGDASALVSFYTADAVNMPSFQSTQNGRAELEDMFTTLFSSSTDDVLSQVTDEIFVHGGMAYEFGTVEFERKPKSSDGEARVRQFRYVSAFKQQSDGSWKFHRWLGQSN